MAENGNGFTSVNKFCQIFITIMNHPGLRQKSIVAITGVGKHDVSRLTKVGIQTGLIEKRGNNYHEGPVIKTKTEALINLLSKED